MLTSSRLSFHLPVGRIILHNTMLVELDACSWTHSLLLVRGVWNTVETGQVRFEFCAWKNSDGGSKAEILGSQRWTSPSIGSANRAGDWTAGFWHWVCSRSCPDGFWFCFGHDWRGILA